MISVTASAEADKFARGDVRGVTGCLDKLVVSSSSHRAGSGSMSGKASDNSPDNACSHVDSDKNYITLFVRGR